MKLRKSLACLLILAFVFANLPTGMAMVNAENAGSTGSSASVFARTVTTQSDSGFTSPVYFFQQGYTDKVNSSTAKDFTVKENLLVATASTYAYVMLDSGATDWNVASGGQLKFDIKAGWNGDITFRIIQKQNDVQAKVNITVPVTATMTEQTIDLSAVSGLDLTNVWGFGIVSYCGEVTLDNLRLEWTTGEITDDEFTSPVYFFKQGYTNRINTDLVTNFSVTDGALVAPNGVYASVQFKSGSENWRVASKGQLKFDVKAGSSGNILFRIIQEHHEIQNYVQIEVPVTAEMTEQTIDLSTVSGLDLTSVWGFGVVSYYGEVSFDNVRLEWTEDYEFTSPVYFFKQGYTDKVNSSTAKDFTVEENLLVATANTYAYVMLDSAATNWSVASGGKLKFDIKAGKAGDITFRIIQKQNDVQQKVDITIPVTTEMTEQTIDLSSVSGLDLSSVWGFGIVSYCGEVTLDNVRLEWTTGEEPITGNKTFYYFKDDFNGTVSDTTYNTVVSGTWEVSKSYARHLLQTTTVPEITAADVENATLKFKLKVSSGIGGEIYVYLGNAVDAGGWVKSYLSEYVIGFDNSNTDWQEISVPLKDFPTTAAYDVWNASPEDTRELDITKLDVFGINCKTWGGDGKVYFDEVRLEWTQSTAPVKNVKLNGGVLSLDGKIGVKMYLNIPEDVSREAIVNITAPDGTVSSVTVGDGKVTENGIMFYCPVAAKEMTVDIKIQVVDGADASDELKYSVKKYADGLLAGDYSEKSKALIKAMLNYGAMAQKLFDYKTDSLANSDLEASDQDLSAITADTLAAYAKEKQSVEGVATLAGTILSLESETTLKLFFSDVAEGATFTYNGAAITPTQSGSYYMVAITNIAAKDLNKDYTVTINGKDFTFSAMSFCANVLNGNYTGDKADELVNVAKALYAYSAAADVYFGE